MRLTGFVLAGGRGTRLGADKSRLRLGRESLLRRNLGLLRTVCADAAVVGLRRRLPEGLGAAVVDDILPGCGPLGGIHAGLSRSSTRYN